MRAVPMHQVEIRDQFWEPRQQANRDITVPHLFAELEQVGNIPNLRLASEGKRTGYRGPVYMDSDLYKAMESASYVLALYPDAPIREKLEEVIGILERAQTPEGYLNSYFQVVAPDRRWKNLRDDHELYCAGHLIEAGGAHYEATKSERLLKIAIRYADYIDSVFGDAPGKRMGYCGHPEIELALFRLYRTTGERRYRDLARFFLVNRGKHFFAEEHNIPKDQYDGTTWLDNVPLAEHREIVGHAVRAGYLFAGTTDLVADSGDEALLKMLSRVWANTVQRRVYITGGIGSSAHNEGFTKDYDLPNRTAYQETCASIALIFWAHRMGLLLEEARFFDALERALYNGALAGIGLDGKSFYYVNPLESDGTHHRQRWYPCACCPPNISRLIGSLGGYLYGQTDTDLWVNLYVESRVRVSLKGQSVVLQVSTNAPWDGTVTIQVVEGVPVEFGLHLRVPEWCEKARFAWNGTPIKPTIAKGYAVVRRHWQEGDRLTLELPMSPVLMEAHPKVEADRWQVAIQRGPVVYCLEEIDQPVPLERMAVVASSALRYRWEPNLLNGIGVIEGEAVALEDENAWGSRLYRPLTKRQKVPFRAIPYYAWHNRQPCPMRVWMPVQ